MLGGRVACVCVCALDVVACANAYVWWGCQFVLWLEANQVDELCSYTCFLHPAAPHPHALQVSYIKGTKQAVEGSGRWVGRAGGDLQPATRALDMCWVHA